MSIDLAGFDTAGLVGYRAKRHTGIIDVDLVDALDPRDYWEAIHVRARRELILDPGEFYLLASKESVRVPPDHAAEMTPFDPLVGEFRVHYAGFFDPGFGCAEAGGAGSRAVLEVRSRDVPFVLEDGQIVGRLVYERMSERAADALRHGGGIELPGAGAEAVEAFQARLKLITASEALNGARSKREQSYPARPLHHAKRWSSGRPAATDGWTS